MSRVVLIRAKTDLQFYMSLIVSLLFLTAMWWIPRLENPGLVDRILPRPVLIVVSVVGLLIVGPLVINHFFRRGALLVGYPDHIDVTLLAYARRRGATRTLRGDMSRLRIDESDTHPIRPFPTSGRGHRLVTMTASTAEDSLEITFSPSHVQPDYMRTIETWRDALNQDKSA